MTKQEKKVIEEAKQLLRNAKHWQCWLMQKENKRESDQATLETLEWLIANMQETKKLD